LMAACQIDTPPDLPPDGLNQLSVLRGENDAAPTPRFWQFNRYDPVDQCNAAMRDAAWKLYWPRIPEAMAKLPADSEDYRRNFERPHLLKPVDNPPVTRNLSPPSAPQLYNIDEDPYEQHDLARQHPRRVSQMAVQLANWFETVERDRVKL
jgi:hypothetical protein